MYALSVAKMEWFKFILQFCIESVSTTTQAAFAGFAAVQPTVTSLLKNYYCKSVHNLVCIPFDSGPESSF